MSNNHIDMLLNDLTVSTCNFTAVEQIIATLYEHGFEELDEAEPWEIRPGGKYFMVKNATSVFPFVAGTAPIQDAGVRIISAHTDSPCFKLKPNCEIIGDGGVVSLNVEKYGGGIMYTWFDRPLSIAGRVVLRTAGSLWPDSVVVDLQDPIAVIPHLAIHFNRAVNEGNPLSVQNDMKPVIGWFSEDELAAFRANGGIIKTMLAAAIRKDYAEDYGDLNPEDILDYELALYPVDRASLVGLGGMMLQSARIDDLSMAYTALYALLDTCDTPCEATRVVALFDNEETGSGTKQGAASPVLRHLLERVCIATSPDPQAFYMALANSFMISADDAHGWHPNYNSKYDPTNHPVLGGGPVVKINANCKYMTDAVGAGVFHSLCEKAGVNMQYFVNHADVAGGSTLGNISSSQLDIDGVDVGCAIWAMHSARETASVSDHLDMIKVFKEFFK